MPRKEGSLIALRPPLVNSLSLVRTSNKPVSPLCLHPFLLSPFSARLVRFVSHIHAKMDKMHTDNTHHTSRRADAAAAEAVVVSVAVDAQAMVEVTAALMLLYTLVVVLQLLVSSLVHQPNSLEILPAKMVLPARYLKWRTS